MKQIILFLIAATFFQTIYAQSNYNHREAFHPVFYPYPGNEIRSASGAPGPKYWQNRADYFIDVTLNPVTHSVSGKVTIHYINNSQDELRFIWLQLDQNIYRKDSRATATTTNLGGRWANEAYTEGYGISKMETEYRGEKKSVTDTLLTDTRLQVYLPTPLKSGDSVKLHLSYLFSIPEYGTDRMGRLLKKQGWIYEVAQWYPRVCVYDDISGWNTHPYLGAGEFYLEYGNVNYQITAPSNMIVVGSGALQNPEACYTIEQLERWKEAEQSDKTVYIRKPNEIKNNNVDITKLTTWKFLCENTRDVAWAASEAFVMDAARIQLPSGKNAMAVSVYPKESTSEKSGNDWKRSTEYS